MKNYQITFNLSSRLVFNELPTFDGILSYCYAKEVLGDNFGNYNSFNISFFDDMPIKKHEDGWFYGSFMFYDEDEAVFDNAYYLKYWDGESNHEKIVDFEGKRGKIDTQRGEFKGYFNRLQTLNIKRIWFFFTTDNVKQVEYLLKKYLVGIGKKVSQGYGLIDSFEIIELNYYPFEKIIRPIPVRDKKDLLKYNKIIFSGFRPPYWDKNNQAFCRVG